MRLIQITLGAGATRVTTAQIYTPALFIQNNGTGVMRVGDNTVSATKGIALLSNTGPGGGTYTCYRPDNRIHLADYYVFGTAGQLVDVLYE